MNNLLANNDELHYVAKATDFNECFKAIQAAEWVADPTDPTNTRGGCIRMGETVWLRRGHFGSGPEWTQACFTNKTLGYVHLDEFKRVEQITASTE